MKTYSRNPKNTERTKLSFSEIDPLYIGFGVLIFLGLGKTGRKSFLAFELPSGRSNPQSSVLPTFLLMVRTPIFLL